MTEVNDRLQSAIDDLAKKILEVAFNHNLTNTEVCLIVSACALSSANELYKAESEVSE